MSSTQTKPNKDMNRSQRCGVCQGCQAKACGQCVYCADSPQFGGPGVKKQSCLERRCHRVLENRLQRDAPTFKAKAGCNICDECRQTADCQVCLVCLDRKFFQNRYLPGAMCAKKRCNQSRAIDVPPVAQYPHNVPSTAQQTNGQMVTDVQYRHADVNGMYAYQHNANMPPSGMLKRPSSGPNGECLMKTKQLRPDPSMVKANGYPVYPTNQASNGVLLSNNPGIYHQMPIQQHQPQFTYSNGPLPLDTKQPINHTSMHLAVQPNSFSSQLPVLNSQANNLINNNNNNNLINNNHHLYMTHPNNNLNMHLPQHNRPPIITQAATTSVITSTVQSAVPGAVVLQLAEADIPSNGDYSAMNTPNPSPGHPNSVRGHLYLKSDRCSLKSDSVASDPRSCTTPVIDRSCHQQHNNNNGGYFMGGDSGSSPLSSNGQGHSPWMDHDPASITLHDLDQLIPPSLSGKNVILQSL